jgi:hypothetical protein
LMRMLVPVRADRWVWRKVPKPVNVTAWPAATVRVIVSSIASTIQEVSQPVENPYDDIRGTRRGS